MKPMLRYPGAKWLLSGWVAQYLPQTPHYLESHCGSAAVYLNLPYQPRHAVLNDRNGDVTNLLRIIRERSVELAALIEMTPWSREEYALSYEVTDDPLEQARRFLVRSWQAQHADQRGTAGWAHRGYKTLESSTTGRWNALPDRLLATVSALKDAEIENQDALDLIAECASPDVLIYADPPYLHHTRSKKLYAHEMTDAAHNDLLAVLDRHPGPVAISGYRSALYDTRLVHWRRVEADAIAEKGGSRVECLWINQACQDRLGYGPLFAGL